jgi:hypothetical protein
MNNNKESVENAKNDVNIVIQGVSEPEKPSNYLTWSVLNTIFCCSLFGLLATIYSVKTRESIRHGLSEQEIIAYSLRACFFNFLSLICGFITISLYFYINVYLK